MTSEARQTGADRAYVWVWLPGADEPVVAGVIQVTASRLGREAVLAFRYAQSYLRRPDRISLFIPELPLGENVLDPSRPAPGREPLPLAGCLRDAAPDAWGRRVINLHSGLDAEVELSELAYLLASGSDRIGALDFQSSPIEYRPRGEQEASLDQLATQTASIDRGESLPAGLDAALNHGTSIGGARPKALLRDGDRQLIAKFSASQDDRPVVQAEGVAMLLAARAGIDVAGVELARVAGKEVLLVERFDREPARPGTTGTGLARRQMVSMLTVLGLSENGARYGSYAQMARSIRRGPSGEVPQTLLELFARLVLNLVVGNTDDHLRNHAAFWDGSRLRLTPAYDLAPQRRSGHTSSQAIGITAAGDRASQLRLCRAVAGEFLLSARQAEGAIERVRTAVVEGWDEACDRFELTRDQRRLLWGREFGNAYLDWDQA